MPPSSAWPSVDAVLVEVAAAAVVTAALLVSGEGSGCSNIHVARLFIACAVTSPDTPEFETVFKNWFHIFYVYIIIDVFSVILREKNYQKMQKN